MRELIMMTVDDLVSDFLVYDRKEDEELSTAQLVQTISDGTVTVDEIVDRFRSSLVKDLA